jgi:hypothetical protein
MVANGTRVELLETPNAPHDTFGAGSILGFIMEATEAAELATKFVDEQVSRMSGGGGLE